ncbi:hypothetical protein [Halomonas heilongjiangensis]|uniref:Uncharacterized protein n=1 Tax=Halomonas heilongjiangensis TaxID=1387883 RepID=A0A2N7TGE5_9GAMM|nr:hypothetical protein [Halomonas heilongjiangensis]PMR67267.1 hypothetical protein C1H66_20295 [Halomonas heilongjiangensis]PXX92224.1 hypothetical protein CR158_06085 [Halomonas heilongjiangensis]
MRHFIAMTFGGLSPRYYLRQLFFGAGMSALLLFVVMQGEAPLRMDLVVLLLVNALLYPYSRFVYEQAMGFLMGDNMFFVNAMLLLSVKLFTMMLCWGFAIFIAPLGLAYLFFYHRRGQSRDSVEG